jgi:DUF4097 and DUF4098 domain-containing protein YvlB
MGDKMSSYPPPPPPGQYPPVYDRNALRNQRRLIRDQAKYQVAQQRAMRHQLRAQRRSLRRGSVVGPLIILALGVIFLLAQIGRLSWGQSLDWYGRWWPAVLVIAGVVLLIEWAVDQRREDGLGQTRVIGGGVIFLLIVLAFAGITARAVEYGMEWRDNNFGNGYTQLDHLFGDRHDSDSSMSQAIAPTSPFVIRNPHGDVTVTGSSNDGAVHVSVHTETYAWKDNDASRQTEQLQPTFSTEGGVLSLNVNSVDGGQADLSIELPRTVQVTVQADHGDLNVSQISAPVILTANHGDVDVSSMENSVTLHVNDDDSTITMRSIHGPVSVEGHSGDIDISDITGDLSLQGDFFGSTNLEHVTGAVRFNSTRTQFSAARLDEDFSVDRDSLNANALLGPVVLKTADKNITLDRVQGSVDVTDRNGSVEVTNAAPLQQIQIQNQHGSIDVGLPGNVGFFLDAQTRNGDMENDFGLTESTDNDKHSLNGRVSGGGATVTLSTSDGDVTVRKSTVAPLPPVPPAVVPFTSTPTVPAAPKAPHAPRVPKPPTPPPAPANTSTF